MATKKLPDWLKYNADGSADITLSRPMDMSGVKVSVIRMREPTVADQEAASERSGSDATREILAFADLCQMAPDDIRKMPAPDYRRMQAAYMGFFD